MVDISWNNFKVKFSGKEQESFERLCYILFCKEFKKDKGIPRYKNQAGIETEPIEVNKINIGWQARFYETRLSEHKRDFIESINTTKRKYPEVNKIIFYTNRDFGQGKRKDPKCKKEIEKHAKVNGVEIEWRTASFFDSPFVCVDNKKIVQHYFALDKKKARSKSNKDKIEILSALLAQYDVRRNTYQTENANLKRSSNPRFGFSYMEPRTWDRFDPINGDGNRYVHPTKTDIIYIVSGIHEELDEDEINTAIENHLNYLKKVKGFNLILSSPSGGYFYDYTDANTIIEQKIEGWRLKYKLTDRKSKNRLTVLEFKCYYDGVCFTVYCRSPDKEYDNFEDFFLYLISEFRVLGKRSAPFARS